MTLGIQVEDVNGNLSVGSTNFIVTPEVIIVVENLSAHQSVALGIDLSTALLEHSNSVATSGPVALTINKEV